jgi:gliding motility-associated-like protein
MTEQMYRVLKIIVFVFLVNFGYAQTYTQACISDTRLNRNDGCANWQTTNYGAATTMQASTWTYVGIGCSQGDIRGLLKFDINPPTTAQVLYDNRATLNLNFPTGNGETHFYTGSGTDNQFYVQLITTNWDEYIVTWNSQPTTTVVGQILVPSAATNPSTQDYQIDVSSLVYDWICGTTPNYGFRIILVNETQIYRRVTFATREWADSSDHPSLTLEYAYIAASGPDTICEGDAFNVNCALNNAATPANYNYQWTHTNSGTNYATQNLVNPAWTLGLNTYIVTVTNPWCQTAKDTVEIFVEAQPIADAGNDTSVCAVQNIQLTASGGSSFQWSTGATTASINVTPALTTTYYVTVNNGNCSAVDSITVSVYSVLPVQLSGDTICDGDIGNISVNGGSSWLWSNGNTTSNVSVSPTQTTTYYVTVTDSNNCQLYDSTLVVVYDYPQLSLQKTDAHCGQSDGTIQSFVSGGSGLYTYNWSPVSSTNPDLNNIPAGNYTLSVSDNGCETVASIIVVDIPGPLAAFSVNPAIAEAEQLVYFMDYSIGATSWQWDFGDGNGSIQQNPTHTYLNPGFYDVYLTVTDDFGCEDETYKELEIIETFVIHIPNSFTPNNDGINDVFKPLGVRIDIDRYKFQIYDRWGKKVFETTDYNQGWDGSIDGKIRSDDNKMSATFVYYVYVVRQGTETDHEFIGIVTLIR